MSKQASSSEPAKRLWHTPQLFVIRGQDTAQVKIYRPFEGGKRSGAEHITGSGQYHGPGSAGPS